MEASTLTAAGHRGLLARRSPLLRLQSDEKLVAMIRDGQDHAFEVLFDRYQSRLLSFCRHMVGSSLDLMAAAFAGSKVGLDPFARLLGEDSLRPITRTLVSGFEALMFGTGLAFGLMRRPKADG